MAVLPLGTRQRLGLQVSAIVGMLVGWVVWRSDSGLTKAHYVGAPGTRPVCGVGLVASWGKRTDDRIPAPADSSRCDICERLAP